jgi:hypothetical protein
MVRKNMSFKFKSNPYPYNFDANRRGKKNQREGIKYFSVYFDMLID